MIERMLFENLLTKATERLSQDLNTSSKYHNSRGFEQRVREVSEKFEKEMQGRIEILVPPKDNYVFVDDRVVKPNNSK